jgi:rubredoxin
MSVEVKKIPGGFEVDGLKLFKGKCGCTSIAKCCYSWSKVKKTDTTLNFIAKMTSPDTADTYNWRYTVQKDGVTVNVMVEDARDKEIYSGFIPPSVKEWESRGWEVLEKEGDREDGTVWRCAMCKWLYRDDTEGTAFDQLPADWKCPVCNAPKSHFEKIG